MSIIIILAVILAFIAGYREVEILCSRGSWSWKDFKRRWYLFADQNNVGAQNKDSFHISNGVIFLIIAYFLTEYQSLIYLWEYWSTLAGNIVIYWIMMMYVRDLAMHVIIPRWEKGNPNLRLVYIIPFFGQFFDIKKKK
jgi:hypothetical protein